MVLIDERIQQSQCFEPCEEPFDLMHVQDQNQEPSCGPSIVQVPMLSHPAVRMQTSLTEQEMGSPDMDPKKCQSRRIVSIACSAAKDVNVHLKNAQHP